MNIRVASRVGKRLKKRLKDLRKVVNFTEILKMLEIDGKALSRPKANFNRYVTKL